MRSKAPFFFFCLSTTCGAYRMTAPRCQFCTLFFFLFFYFLWVFTLSRALSCVRLGTLSSCECWTCIVVDRYSRLLCSFFFFLFFFGRVMFVHSCLCEMCRCTHVVFSRGSANGFLTFFMRLVAFFFSLSLLQHSVASCVSALLFWELWSAAFFFSFLFRCSVSIWCCCVAGFSYFSWPSLTRHLSFLFSSVFFFSGLQSRRKRGRRARINKQTNNKKKAYYGFVFHSVDLSFPVVYREEKKRKRVLFRGLPK